MKSNDEDFRTSEDELQIIRDFFDSANRDSSGFIDETELAAVVDLSSDEIKQIFQKLDTDKDGKISIGQFTEYYKQYQLNSHDDDGVSKNRNNGEQRRQDLTRESIRDSGYSMSEPSHRKNRPPVKSETKRKAAKYLGQEYLDDLYEVARSRDDPLLLESLENFLAATVDNLLQKQADNERLDAALKHAKDQNTEIAAQIEEEMEHQVAALEEKIRNEEHEKLQQQKHEAHAQLIRANSELSEMELKIIALENKLEEQKLNENTIPDQFIEKVQKKEQENQHLQAKIMEFQTQMALMRTEVAAMKSEYDEQASRLNNERGTVLGCIQEQESLTRQLQMLHEANKKLHDTNDDLRSALDQSKQGSSFMKDGISPLKRSKSCAQTTPYHHDLYSSFRSDPGHFRYNSTLNNTDFNDTDEDSRQSFPHDDDDDVNINRKSLMAELMNADNQFEQAFDTSRPTSLPNSFHSDNSLPRSEREQFAMQLDILAETNRRLGESNDDLRAALSLLSEQARSEKELSMGTSDLLSMRESPPGCYSAPTTPIRTDYKEYTRPNSTSSPRKVLLTKSGYHSLSDSAPDLSTVGLPKDDLSTTQTEPTSTFCTTCDAAKTRTGDMTTCETCNNVDTDNILEEISLDDSFPKSFPATKTDPAKKVSPKKNKDGSKQNKKPDVTAKSPLRKPESSDLEPVNQDGLQSGSNVLPKNEFVNEDLIESENTSNVEHSNEDFDALYKRLEEIPLNVCEACEETKKIDYFGKEQCSCTKEIRRRLQESVLLTDSDSDSEYSDQETSHFGLNNRGKRPRLTEDSEQYATYEFADNDDENDETTNDISKLSAFDCRYDDEKPKPSDILRHNFESELSMYNHGPTDEEVVDDDSMDDEELIRLVDQTTNDDTTSVTDELITVEEKILLSEPRTSEVGADASSESTLSGDVSGEPDEMYKLVLAGNAAVGKSSFILRLCKNKFYSALNATLGVDFQMKRLNVDRRNTALQLWDTAGQERFRSIAKSYFRRVDGVILLYDVTCESSFLDVRDWIESIESSSSERAPIILCGNKVDLRAEAVNVGMPVISREQGRALANEVGALFVETSAKDGTNIHKACKDLVRLMHSRENGGKPKVDDTVTLDTNNNNNKKKAGCCRN